MTLTDKGILDKYNDGQRYFKDIDLNNGDLSETNLQGISFDNCFLAVDFRGANLRGAKFTNSNIKTCNFRGADLTDAHFENLLVDSADFEGAKADRATFKDGYYHSATLQQADFDEWTKRKK
ncbi:MAG: pentapeptide repeat-containing protein [Bacteroidota bacterium]